MNFKRAPAWRLVFSFLKGGGLAGDVYKRQRLGEGTGACLLFPALDCAAALLSEMAAFDDLGVWFPEEWPPESPR